MSTQLMKFARKILIGLVILFGLMAALGIAFTGYLLILNDQSLVLPSPTGSYSVGRTEFDWVDSSRIDQLSDQPNQNRELLVWVWYPASAQGVTAPYLPPDWVKAYDESQGIGQYIESNFSNIQTHSFTNVPISTTQDMYPVVIMQPGMGPVPTDYTVFAENLASHGYFVIGINEIYTSNLVVFPDGRVIQRSGKGAIPDSDTAAQANADANRIGKVWAADAIFVMNRLQNLNADASGIFYHKLDLAHLGLFGHSFGGATAASVCKLDARCKAGADLDGTLFSDQAEGTFQTPFMFMAEDDCGKGCDSMVQAYSTSNSPAYYLSIKGTRHFNYSDLPYRLLPPSRIIFNLAGYIGRISPGRALEISNAYLVAFFNRYLKNIDSDLLLGAAPYPEVLFQFRKP